MNDPKPPKPTLTSISRGLGVSPKTVSNAFNRPDQLSPGLRERILATAREVGYAGPDPLARAFRTQSSRVIGVIYGNRLSHAFADVAFVTFLAGLSEVLEDEGFGLTLIPGPASDYHPGVGVRDTVMDGAIIYSLATDDPVLIDLTGRSVPFVTVDQPRQEGVVHIGIADHEGGRLVADWLIQQGHSRIGVVAFAMNRHPRGEVTTLDALPPVTLPVTGARLAGIATVLDETVTPVVHVYGSSEESGENGAMALLRLYPDLTALICLGDRMAVGALKAGREVGKDVVVTGFDDVMPGHMFATIHQPHREKGVAAATALLAFMRGENPESIEFPVYLVTPPGHP
jgi:DNA-binding LacI/PurR family transcriptional regulator